MTNTLITKPPQCPDHPRAYVRPVEVVRVPNAARHIIARVQVYECLVCGKRLFMVLPHAR
jgi:hypothetical protein